MTLIQSGKDKNAINLNTDRLFLRNLEPEDVDDILDLWIDPDVTEFMGGPREINDLRKGLTEDSSNPYEYEYDLWPVIEKSSGTLVGHCGLLEKEIEGKSEIEVIYVIKKKYWGRAYASEAANALIEYAFTQKKLNRVVAMIKPANKRSERVAEKCGMKFEKEILRMENVTMKLYVKEMSSGCCR